jgi:hypothetical protein
MQSAASTEPAMSAPCRTCGQPLPAGKALCPTCGAAHGEANRCPHCRALADVEPHRALGFRCLVCGGPRIAIDLDGVTLGDSAKRALESAAREQTKHLMFTAGGLVLAGMGALALLIATVVVVTAAPGIAAGLAAFLAAGVPLAAGLWALTRATGARRLRDRALHQARVAALANVQAITGVLDAARVAQLMRLDAEQAELLLAEASVATMLDEAPAPRLRVDDTQAPAIVTEQAPAIVTEIEGQEATASATGAQKGDTERGA